MEYEIWIYRGLLVVFVPVVGFWLVRFVKSVDKLSQAVTLLQQAVKVLTEKDKINKETFHEIKTNHRDFDKRLDSVEKDVVILKNQNPNYINYKKRHHDD